MWPRVQPQMPPRASTSGLTRSNTIVNPHVRAVGETPPVAASPRHDVPHHPPPNVPLDTVLFVRNLRLLDLDRLPDWPNITPETFSISKDAVATQKARVQAAEWVLYRLFETWDPRETKAVSDGDYTRSISE